MGLFTKMYELVHDPSISDKEVADSLYQNQEDLTQRLMDWLVYEELLEGAPQVALLTASTIASAIEAILVLIADGKSRAEIVEILRDRRMLCNEDAINIMRQSLKEGWY